MHKHTSFSEETPRSSWSVVLEQDQDALVAKIEGYPENIPSDFAFYLMRGKDLIEKRWYSEKMSARFSQPTIPGDYHAIGFVRTKPDVTPEFKKSAVVVKVGRPLYDLLQWKQSVFDYRQNQEWPEKDLLCNGIHRFAIGKEETIDVRLDGAERLQDNGVVLVCFGGAVPKRNTKSAPFFSGIGVAAKLGMPVLAVADPIIGRSATLALAWYAGGEGVCDLPSKIARVLDAFSARYQSKFVVFGGSGGGFASISVLGHLRSPATGFVWNPQTAIGKYWSASVKNYLDVAFPLASGKTCSIQSRLESSGINHDLVVTGRSQKHPLLYLQNQSDKHHVEHHAQPFASVHRSERVSNTVYADGNGLVFWFGNWGDGHAVPPGPMIFSILKELASGKDPRALALRLEEEAMDEKPFNI